MANYDSQFLTAAQVRARYGNVSRMWLFRRLEKDGFPQPILFGGRSRFFRLTELEEWERAMIQRGITTSPPKAKR